MSTNSDDGLPPVDESFGIESLDRWPLGVHELELWSGVLLFCGDFDERDVTTARKAFPGRAVALNYWWDHLP